MKPILCRTSTKKHAMHAIKITPNLLFEYQRTSGKFIRLPNRIESYRNFLPELECSTGRRDGPAATDRKLRRVLARARCRLTVYTRRRRAAISSALSRRNPETADDADQGSNSITSTCCGFVADWWTLSSTTSGR